MGTTQYYVNLPLLIHFPCADFYYYPLTTLTYSFHALTCPSLYTLQEVSALAWSLSFYVLTSPS